MEIAEERKTSFHIVWLSCRVWVRWGVSQRQKMASGHDINQEVFISNRFSCLGFGHEVPPTAELSQSLSFLTKAHPVAAVICTHSNLA
jgi:hypothetical protein